MVRKAVEILGQILKKILSTLDILRACMVVDIEGRIDRGSIAELTSSPL
mgnify:CR=1 FL=1